jgi:hypothetical protein
MAFLNQTFTAAELPQGNNSYELLPDGWYTATITKADVSPTKDGTGQYIKMRYDITGPKHQGRVVFGNLNIRNQSVKAEEIGRQQLGEVMRAIGLASLSDSDQLVGGTLQIKVATRAASGGYEAQNEVKGFKSAGGTVAPVAAASAPKAASASSTPPWMK